MLLSPLPVLPQARAPVWLQVAALACAPLAAAAAAAGSRMSARPQHCARRCRPIRPLTQAAGETACRVLPIIRGEPKSGIGVGEPKEMNWLPAAVDACLGVLAALACCALLHALLLRLRAVKSNLTPTVTPSVRMPPSAAPITPAACPRGLAATGGGVIAGGASTGASTAATGDSSAAVVSCGTEEASMMFNCRAAG